MKKFSMLIGKVKKSVLMAATVIYLSLAYSNQCRAFNGSVYETGTKKMASDLLKVLQGVVGGVALALWVFWEIQKRLSEDNEDVKFSKKQKGLIVGVVIAETIGTLFGIIGGYYGISL